MSKKIKLELADLVYFDSVDGTDRSNGVVVEIIDFSDKCRIFWYHTKKEMYQRRYVDPEISRVKVMRDDSNV